MIKNTNFKLSFNKAVQVAIHDNLKKLESTDPRKRVGIVTFNKEVNVIGDGKINRIKINDISLYSEDEIKLVSQKTPNFDIIGTNKGKLIEQVLRQYINFFPKNSTIEIFGLFLKRLEEGGGTALGPALLYSVLIAARKPGSKVLLCTDGMANIGLGRLDKDSTKDEAEKARIIQEADIFYNKIIDLAKNNG